jgi:hypothetical protein
MTSDGESVAVLHDQTDETNTFHRTLVLTPTGPGVPRTLDLPIEVRHAASSPLGRRNPTSRTADFSADGNRLLIPAGRAPGQPPRVYVHDLGEGWTRPVTPEHVTGPAVLSPDGLRVIVKEGEALMVYPVDGGEGQPAPGPVEPGEPARWSADGRSVFVIEYHGATARLVRRRVSTGEREVLRDIRLSDSAGAMFFDVWVAADGQAYAYATSRSPGALFLVEGLR